MPKKMVVSERVKMEQKLQKAQADVRSLKQGYRHALKQNRQLEKEREAQLAVKDGGKVFAIKPKLGTDKSEATAVWLASDWHVGERVTFAQTNGLNQFKPEIAQARAEAYFRNGLRLTKMLGQDVRITEVVLAFLGDFITGFLHDEAVENNYMAPVEEALFAKSLLASGIEFILKNSRVKLTIVCHSGNHGRTTRKSHFGSENGHSLEFFMYQALAEQFAGNKRVTFIIPEGAHSYLNIYEFPVRFLHGHDIRYHGGSGGVTIPANKAIAQWDKGRKAYLSVWGHFHQYLDCAGPSGGFVINGSLIGYNAFALSIKATAEAPVQAMFLIDKMRGKTLSAPILVT